MLIHPNRARGGQAGPERARPKVWGQGSAEGWAAGLPWSERHACASPAALYQHSFLHKTLWSPCYYFGVFMLVYIIQFCEIGFIIANFYSAFATFKTQTSENLSEFSQDSPWYVTGRNVTFSSRVLITVSAGHYRRSQLNWGGIHVIWGYLK